MTPNERLAEQVTALISGRAPDVIAWLETLGCRLIYRGDNEWHLVGLTGITVGVTPLMDPVSVVASLGMLLAGEQWPWVYSDAMKVVRDAWSKRVKDARTTKAVAP